VHLFDILPAISSGKSGIFCVSRAVTLPVWVRWMMGCCCSVRFQNLANVYLKRYPGLNINIDAELSWYKVVS